MPMFQDRTRSNGYFAWKLFQVYIAKLTAKLAKLSEVMIVAPASNAPICIVHTRDIEGAGQGENRSADGEPKWS